MKNTISHKGIIDSVTEGDVMVRIVQAEACAGCKVAANCSAAHGKEKIVEVACKETSQFSVGDEVVVLASQSVGTVAVMYGFVLPFAVFVLTMAGTYAAGATEVVIGLAGIGALIPYYIILYLCRDYFKRKITFSITKQDC